MPNYSLQNGKQRVIVGHLGKDPEVQQLKSTQLCKFSVAVTLRQQVTSEDGKKKWVDQPTEWYSCKAFGNNSTAVQFHFHRGDPIMVAGHDESWETRDGSIMTDLVVDVVGKPIVIKSDSRTEDNDLPF